LADVLIINPKLKRFCKVTVTDANLLEAVYLAKYRWQKSEEERIRKEDEDRAKEHIDGGDDN